MIRRLAGAAGVMALVVASAAPALAAETVDVTMKNFAFAPTPVNVNVGDTVRWTNDDGVAHNVSGLATPSGNFVTGSFQLTFNSAGTFNYFCSLHGSMVGVVNVTEAPEPVIPEVPLAALLPVAGLAALGAATILHRRRVATR